jgi:hypothetical protein
VLLLAVAKISLALLADFKTKVHLLVDSKTKVHLLADSKTKVHLLADSKTKVHLLVDSKTKVHLLVDSKTKVHLLVDSKTKVHLLVDSKTKVHLLNLRVHLHRDVLSRVNFNVHLLHHSINLASSLLPVDFKINALHNLDHSSHNLKTGDVHQANLRASLINVELQVSIISASLLLHHKILAISVNLEGKMITRVPKVKTKVVDHSHLLHAKDNEIEFLRKKRNLI